VREALKIPFVHQRNFYARTLAQGFVFARMWHNSRAHHSASVRERFGIPSPQVSVLTIARQSGAENRCSATRLWQEWHRLGEIVREGTD